MICRYWLLRDVRSSATPRDVTQCPSFSHVLLSPVLGGFPLAVAARSVVVPNLRIPSLQSMFHRLPQSSYTQIQLFPAIFESETHRSHGAPVSLTMFLRSRSWKMCCFIVKLVVVVSSRRSHSGIIHRRALRCRMWGVSIYDALER